jgi:hypothetical protein
MNLTFGQLVAGELFKVEGTSILFEKTAVRKRSGVRPFATNAKAVSGAGRSVKSGWFINETEVEKVYSEESV